MSEELDVLGLRKKIETMRCDPYERYAFISYSHDNHDALIVYRIFKRLYEMGYNLWIDTANLPYNAENWTKAAIGALRKKECKLALFFRSESSMLKDTIERELETIKLIDHIDSPIVIDIWEDENNSAAAYQKKIANGEDDGQYETFMKICDVVKPGCNAFRFAADYHNDIDNIAKALAMSLDRGGIYCNKSRSNPANNAEKVVVEKSQIEKPQAAKPDTSETKQEVSAPVNRPTKKKSPSEYRYTIFSKEHYAGSGGQGQLMFDAFEVLTERYPQKVEALTELSSVIQAEKVDGNDNPPVYFRTKKRFTVAGKDYYVGTSFSLGDKLTQIKKMFKICGESPDEFVLLK